MRVSVQRGDGQRLFFTAGNHPTQAAYGLNQEDVTSAFVTSVLLGDVLLLAASYFFESAATRSLVSTFPRIWREDSPRALFFISAEYSSYTEHGLIKRKKSPSELEAYRDASVVKQRGRSLDKIGIVGVRENIAVSQLLVEMWKRSCVSNAPGSLGVLISKGLSPEQAAAGVMAAIQIADSCRYDFVWPAIRAAIERDPWLGCKRHELQQAHADMYAQFMSVTLSSTETTPTCSFFGGSVSERTVGHLGLFSWVLKTFGLDPSSVREDAVLRRLLDYEPLTILRKLHLEIVNAAVAVQQDATDYWRAVSVFESRGPDLTDRQVRGVLVNAFRAAGIPDNASLVGRVLALENAYEGKFFHSLRTGLAQILDGSEGKTLMRPWPSRLAKDVLLFAWADPLGPNCGIGADREFQKVRGGLEGLREKCGLRLEVEPALTVERLPTVLTFHQPRLFHFSGHGSKSGEVLLEPGAATGRLSIGNIISLIAEFSPKTECVVFSACHSATAAPDLGHTVRYVILMTNALDERDAMAFAHGFYLQVGIGVEVPKAFSAGLRLLDIENRDRRLPRLYEWGRLLE